MKHGENPTVKQRKILEANGMNWKEWLVNKDTPVCVEVSHRTSGVTEIIRK